MYSLKIFRFCKKPIDKHFYVIVQINVAHKKKQKSYKQKSFMGILVLAFLTVALAAITLAINSGKLNFNPNEGAEASATPHPLCAYPNACYTTCPTNYISKTGSCNTGVCCGPKLFTPTPGASSTPVPKITPTPPPSSCAPRNSSCSNKPCCNYSDVCIAQSGGKFCLPKGTQCTNSQTKCVEEGSVSYLYNCNSGYWQKNKVCGFGCNGSSCKIGCVPGFKFCKDGALKTCNSDGTTYITKSCKSCVQLGSAPICVN